MAVVDKLSFVVENEGILHKKTLKWKATIEVKGPNSARTVALNGQLYNGVFMRDMQGGSKKSHCFWQLITFSSSDLEMWLVHDFVEKNAEKLGHKIGVNF